MQPALPKPLHPLLAPPPKLPSPYFLCPLVTLQYIFSPFLTWWDPPRAETSTIPKLFLIFHFLLSLLPTLLLRLPPFNLLQPCGIPYYTHLFRRPWWDQPRVLEFVPPSPCQPGSISLILTYTRAPIFSLLIPFPVGFGALTPCCLYVDWFHSVVIYLVTFHADCLRVTYPSPNVPYCDCRDDI